MIEVFFHIILILHGLIHILGFAKSLQGNKIKALSQPITPAMGFLWLIAMMLFFACSLLYFFEISFAYTLTFLAIIVSQVLIITQWKDAKFGSIANLLLLIKLLMY